VSRADGQHVAAAASRDRQALTTLNFCHLGRPFRFAPPSKQAPRVWVRLLRSI
jgi:hypothetical protein